jgi:hypothetical protein
MSRYTQAKQCYTSRVCPLVLPYLVCDSANESSSNCCRLHHQNQPVHTHKHAWWAIVLLLRTRCKLGPRTCAEAPAVQQARRSQLRGGDCQLTANK